MKIIMQFITGYCFLILITTSSSCKKQEAAAADFKSTIAGHTWTITAITTNPAMNGVTDIYGGLDDCEKDDLISFNSADVCILTDGIKCDTTYPDTVNGNWYYDESRKILRLIYAYPGASFDIEYLLKEFTADEFKAQLGFTDNGVVYWWTYTFQKRP